MLDLVDIHLYGRFSEPARLTDHLQQLILIAMIMKYRPLILNW